MKTVWILNLRTSLPDVYESGRSYKFIREAYENFDTAKKRVREIIKEFAFADNAMFDGKGYLKYFNRYITDREELMNEVLKDEEGDALDREFAESNFDSNMLTVGFLKVLHKKMHCIFSGEDTPLPFSEKIYNDNTYMQAEVSNDCIQLEGYDDGPCNGINPYIKTNMFDMTEEKDYMLYIDDYFTEYYSDHPEWVFWSSAELYVDLNKIQVK